MEGISICAWRLDGGHKALTGAQDLFFFSSKHRNKRKYSWGKVTTINMFERAILIYICVCDFISEII
jgi:hypothetical protein